MSAPGDSLDQAPTTRGRLADGVVRRAPYASVVAFSWLLRMRKDPLLRIINEHVRSGDVVADIGAYRGWYSRSMAQRTGPLGRVHAFEPNPNGLAVLQGIARRHRNVVIHAVALSDHSGEARLQRPFVGSRRTDAMASLSNPAVDAAKHDEVAVKVARLDDRLGGEADRIRFLKCDVEGHEHEVLVGAEQVILRSRPVIMVEIEQRHRRRPIEETFDWLTRRDYDGFFLTRQERLPLSDFDVERHQQRFLAKGLTSGRPNPDYVSDFLFLPRSRPG